METLRTAQSGEDIRVRLVVTRSGEFLIVTDHVAIGLYALGADMRTKDRVHADRMFDRTLEIANSGLLRHPAWKSTSTNGVRNVPIHQS